MNASFLGEDIVAANLYSKSTLRVAAQNFADTFPDVEYFPSYEMVMLSRRESAFKEDWIHATDPVVDHVMSLFFSTHLDSLPRRFPEFHDGFYLRANPDVEDAVRRGEITSGYHHWLAQGQAEGRPLRPIGS
jgi:hypothetical protein